MPNVLTTDTDLKLQVNAALGEIAAQTKAREAAARQIVHDIRSPLGKVEMWLRPHAAAAGPLARAAATVGEVIDGTRLILTGLSQTRQSDKILSLTDRVNRHLRDMESLAAERGIIFEPAIELDVSVRASLAAVDRLIGNLLQNVIDHGAAGVAMVGLRREGELFRLEIDNPSGTGLPVGKEPAQNFGIGLTSVRDIAAQHGWTFETRLVAERHHAALTGQTARNL